MPGPRLVFPFSGTPPRAHDIWVSKPQARRGARWPDPPGRARPGAARSGLRAPRWPACFARPRRHAEAALWLRGRGQGSAALSGSLPDGASSPAPARSLANLPDPGAARRGGAAARPARRSFGAAAGSRGVCGAPRAGDDAAGRHPAPVLPSRAHRGLSRRPAAAEEGRWACQHCPPAASVPIGNTRRPSELPQPTPRWAQTPVGQGFLDGSQT